MSNPEKGKEFSPEQIDKIWKLKGEFRYALRQDLQFLFSEEIKQHVDED